MTEELPLNEAPFFGGIVTHRPRVRVVLPSCGDMLWTLFNRDASDLVQRRTRADNARKSTDMARDTPWNRREAAAERADEFCGGDSLDRHEWLPEVKDR